MLVTVPLKGGRKQVVKLRVISSQYGKYRILHLQSRACIAQGPAMIRQALRSNAESDCGAYALDTTTAPPAIDVVHGLVLAPECEINPNEIIMAVRRVAAFADDAERRTTGTDVF